MKHQPEDSTDISAAYSLNENGTVRVQNRCLDGAGKLDESIGEATIVDAEHGKLKVSFLPEGLHWVPLPKGITGFSNWMTSMRPPWSVSQT